jgi:hypothetical protein
MTQANRERMPNTILHWIRQLSSEDFRNLFVPASQYSMKRLKV